MFGDWLAGWGEVVLGSVAGIGDWAMFCMATVGWTFRRPPRSSTLFVQLYEVGVRSLPVVALIGTFTGMVLAVQSYYQFRLLHLETQLGAVINLSLVRELGPVLAATMLAGRVGTAMAAELGTMRVTEQIDALTAMGTDPIRQLVVPRLLACLTMIPLLTIMAIFMGVAGGYFYSVIIFKIDQHHYWDNTSRYVGGFDLCGGIAKSFFFGVAIALVSCYRGFHCEAGAEGVGRAATGSFVYSFIMILCLDLILAITIDAIYYSLWPMGGAIMTG